MIRIKNTKVLESMLIHPAHPKLIDLLVWFCVRYSSTVFTGMFEERDYPSVHSVVPVRGMDVRSSVFSDPQMVEADVNDNWVYDPDRPWFNCALFHDVGRGPHFHLQVSDKTVRRELWL
jgi:hypothetical protein